MNARIKGFAATLCSAANPSECKSAALILWLICTCFDTVTIVSGFPLVYNEMFDKTLIFKVDLMKTLEHADELIRIHNFTIGMLANLAGNKFCALRKVDI